MNMQKRTVYAMGISSLICIALYAVCVFLWKTDETSSCYLMKTFISNIMLGLLGSSVISGIVAFIAYLQNRRDTLEKYIFKYHELTAHCSKYMDVKEYRDKVEWFDNFVRYVRDLETIWADIGFIFDTKKNRIFLKDVVDYYNDFIWLTENHYRLLNENIADAAKKSLSEEIDKIVIEEKKTRRGVMQITTRNNRFTTGMASVNKAINDIYKYKTKQKFTFNKSLVSRSVFIVLEDDLEFYAEKMIKLMDESGKTGIELDIPEEVCEKLQKSHYINSYTVGNTSLRNVDCQFILFHYFDLKSKCRDL